MSPAVSDRNLLFGILALQMDFISRDQLVVAMNAWVLDKSKPLGAILVDQKALESIRRGLLEALVDEHLKQHNNDPHLSLAFLSSIDAVKKDLEKIADVDLQNSLQRACSEKGHEATMTRPKAVSIPAGRRFRILRPHAEGGLGKVYVAHDEELHREVALKEIQDRHADHPDSRSRFVLEAEITGGLEHPGIVPVYGLGQYDDGRPYYAMRFIRGDSLKDAIERFHKMDGAGRDPSARALDLRKLLGRFIDVCQAMQYAHDRGVLHRDLKPGNIMLGKYGETLVVDWGLAKAIGTHDPDGSELVLKPASGSGSSDTLPGSAVGTPAFMSPEQAAGRLDQLGPASDVYSLGATLYSLLTGRPSVVDKDMGIALKKVQQGDFPKPRQLKPDIDAALEAICLKAMALKPADRYAAPRELAEDIEHWLGDEPVSAWPEPWTVKTGRWAGRHRTVMTGTAALFAAALPLLAILVALSESARSDLEIEQGKTKQALVATTTAQQQRALAQVNALRFFPPGGVPGILADLEANRDTVHPRLRERFADETDQHKRMRLALALLPVETDRVRDDLTAWMLQVDDPAEVLLIRDVLAPYKSALLDRLWLVVGKSGKETQHQRLRAAAALAKYDPDNPHWDQVRSNVVEDVVAVNPVFMGPWTEAFRPIKGHLLPPLSKIFCDQRPDRVAERTLATSLLADYATDDPQVMADLLMEAEENQFAVIYPKFKEQGGRYIPLLSSEIDKQPVVVKEKMIFETKGSIAEKDPKVEWQNGLLLAKRFEVRLQAGKTYRLTMDSNDLDSFLVLQDMMGKDKAFDDNSGGNMNSLLLYTPSSDDTYKILAASLLNPTVKRTGSFVLKVMETVDGDDANENLAKRQANAAVALLRMNQPEKVWPLLKHSPDPRVRSYLVHRLGPLGADAKIIVERLSEERNVTIRRALILSLGEYAEKDLTREDRKALLPKLQEIYCTEADPGLHASAEWLLRTWKEETWLKKVNDEWAKNKEQRESRLEGIRKALAKDKEKTPPQWYVNNQGQTMVVIPAGQPFVMGSPITEKDRSGDETQHMKQIGRTFALAATPVTKEQFLRFFPTFSHSGMGRYPEPTGPIGGVVWYEAAAYCNWLSKQEGIDKAQWCYETDVRGNVTKLKQNYLSLSGYRLPTEAEMEYATRAGALTSRYYGETEDLLAKYAWYSKNSKERTWPVGSLKPNDFGLFDVQGSVYTWCQESRKPYPAGKGDDAAEDREDGSAIIPTQGRVLRGGSFSYPASYVRSASRIGYVPANRNGDIGFRTSRTLPLGSFTALPPNP